MAAATLLDREGFSTAEPAHPTRVLRPPWAELARGLVPPAPEEAEPGEWAHGWQHYAADTRERFARNAFFVRTTPVARAQLRSTDGRGLMFGVAAANATTPGRWFAAQGGTE